MLLVNPDFAIRVAPLGFVEAGCWLRAVVSAGGLNFNADLDRVLLGRCGPEGGEPIDRAALLSAKAALFQMGGHASVADVPDATAQPLADAIVAAWLRQEVGYVHV